MILNLLWLCEVVAFEILNHILNLLSSGFRNSGSKNLFSHVIRGGDRSGRRTFK